MLSQQAKRRKKRTVFYLKRAIVLGAIVLLLSVITAFLLSCFGREPEPSSNQNGQDTSTTDSGVKESEAGTSVPFIDSSLPEGWQRITMPESALFEGTLVLVNQENNFDASIPKTASVYEHKNRSYLVKDIYLSVTPVTIKALNDWMEAFAAETGITDVNIVSGWRSFADQSAIYDNAVASKGQAHADAYIALPGHSEHHTGLAVDLDTYNVENGTSGGFDGDGEYAWAVQHAWEYGFIQRYPPSKSGITGIDYESWHFRYVGLPHSYVMASENLCLEEYIDYLRNFAFSGEHLSVSCLGASYELYFCPEDQVVVPVSGSYTVSGNNVDGYVIVINTSE